MPKSLQRIFTIQLKDIYSAEKQIAQTLPGIIKFVKDKTLKGELKTQRSLARERASGLMKILGRLGKRSADGENCNTVEGLIDDTHDLFEGGAGTEEEIDAGIINIFQKIVHYKISAYSSLISYAKMLGYPEDAEILQSFLDEEYESDNKLDKVSGHILELMV